MPRGGGRGLGFPSSCSARAASKLFSSVELPVELTQLLSGEKQREAQLTDHFPSPTQALFSACKGSAEPWKLPLNYPKTIKWVHLEYTGQKYLKKHFRSTKINSGLQGSNKKLSVWRLEAAWLPDIQQKSSLVLNTEPVCSI